MIALFLIHTITSFPYHRIMQYLPFGWYLSCFWKETKSLQKFDFFTLRPACFFSIQVSKITLENFELVNYKQRLIFEILIHRPLPLWFQMTARQFWSKHSENKVTLNQSNELAYVNRAHSPSDQLMAFLQVVFTRYENYSEVYLVNKPLLAAGISEANALG